MRSGGIHPEEELFRCTDLFFAEELGAEGWPLGLGMPGMMSYDAQLLRTSERFD